MRLVGCGGGQVASNAQGELDVPLRHGLWPLLQQGAQDATDGGGVGNWLGETGSQLTMGRRQAKFAIALYVGDVYKSQL